MNCSSRAQTAGRQAGKSEQPGECEVVKAQEEMQGCESWWKGAFGRMGEGTSRAKLFCDYPKCSRELDHSSDLLSTPDS